MTSLGLFARLLLLTLAVLGLAAPASAVTADDFLLRSGADLVALCSAPASDPLYTAAIHMCHGFGAGTYQTIQTVTRHERLQPIICPPQPQPTRNEAVRRFLEWAKRNPQHLKEPAVEMVARFFVTEFPCPEKK
jgi:Rap1a immunity proteins